MWRKILAMTVVLVLLGIGLTQPVAAQNVVWTGAYYNNSFLIDQSQMTRQDAAIAFDWGTGSPGGGVNSDGFTVRWASDPYFAAGTYRFCARADDEVRVNVGYAFNPQIDTFNKAKVGETLCADVTLTDGVHHVQVDYREANGQAYVFVNWSNLATNPGGPTLQAPQNPVNVGTGPWTAQYYANAGLTGSPTLIQSEANVNHNWGAGSPIASIPADNFSARWTSLQTLAAGNYQISVRVDDGARVFVNGVSVINQWGPGNSATYTATVTLPAGQHNFMVEYVEFGGNALIEFSVQIQGATNPPSAPPAAPSSTTGVVTAAMLNVRSSPNPTANILLKIRRNESYPVISANADRSWWQINVNGTVGWVSGQFFSVTNGQSVSTTGAPSAPPPANTGYSVTTTVTLNVRSLPSTRGTIVAKIPANGSVPVVGRTASGNWYQVNYQGVVGWVSARFATLQSGADINRIPITG